MSPNSAYNTQEALGKARCSTLILNAPLTLAKMFPAKFFGCSTSPYCGCGNPPTDNEEHIPPNIDPPEETSPGTSERITIARLTGEDFATNKIPRPLCTHVQAGFESRKPLRELSQVEINARSIQASLVVSRTVFFAVPVPEGESNAKHEGSGEGIFRTALSARSVARQQQPTVTTVSPFLIYED